ncbi:MAG: hypothetical protein JXB45_07755 [Candidatus Krumholzibacteriota bacterium]|nr:hypothetical protein [Candidatus Krumholzibacteriota bacterium]
MEIIFLYNRLYALSKKQLAAVRSNDFDLMDELTARREALTAEICQILDAEGVDLKSKMSHRKTQEITGQILEIDHAIKEALLDELLHRTRQLSRLKLIE